MKHIRQTISGFIALAAVAAVSTLISNQAFASHANSQAKSAFTVTPVGKITPWEAMKIAARVSGGKPLNAIYEFDDGQWIYGVVVVKNHKLLEVEIDPTTGKVGETENITPDGEAKEMKSDLKNAIASAGR